jgi:mannose-1-phosphate guanylyltransferase / mannose-6-phosphate isomerase
MKYLILSGGGGTRLWPLSRSRWPKQFLALGADQSLLVQTIHRMVGSQPSPDTLNDVYIVSNAQLVEPIAEDLARCGLQALGANVIAEPVRRNTAPAIGLGAQFMLDSGRCAPDEVVAIFPADHQVPDADLFRQHLDKAEALARQGYIVTLGVPPTHAETGFGYIAVDQPYATADWLPVSQFVEKPDRDTAQGYVDSGRYLWNAGIFVLRIDTLMQALSTHAPDITGLLSQGADQALAQFAAMPDISFDYAVMEHAQQVAVVPLRTAWSDVGCWDSVYDISAKNEQDNACLDETGVLMDNTTGTLVWNASGRHIGLIGLKDCLVVDTPDALLISARGHSQEVKGIVQALSRQEVPAAHSPVAETLSWGDRLRLNTHPASRSPGSVPELPVFRLAFRPGQHLVCQGLDTLQCTLLSGDLALERRQSSPRHPVDEALRLKPGAHWEQAPQQPFQLAVGPQGAVVLATGCKPLVTLSPAAPTAVQSQPKMVTRPAAMQPPVDQRQPSASSQPINPSEPLKD